MKLWVSIAVALRALRANTLRSLLTMLGVIIGVAAVVAMVAVGSGAHAQIAEQIRSLGANLLYVLPQSQDAGGTRLSGGKRFTLTVADAEAIVREIPAVQIAAATSSGELKAVYGNRNWSTTLVGTYPSYFAAREWALAAGQPFTDKDVDIASKVAVLGSRVADKLFGDVDPLGQIVRVANVPFTVIGVLHPKGQSADGWDQDDTILAPFSTAMLRVLGAQKGATRRAVGLILVKVAEAGAMDEAQGEIRALLRQRHQLTRTAPDDFSVRNMESLIRKREATSRTLIVQLAALASVSLIVGGISIMNIMLVSVTERTREIGLRMAVGARRRDIRNQFLIEALTLCLLGGVAGILAGVATAVGIAQIAGWPVVIHPTSALLAFGFAGAVGVFFGFYPARKASRLDPIEALRYE